MLVARRLSTQVIDLCTHLMLLDGWQQTFFPEGRCERGCANWPKFSTGSGGQLLHETFSPQTPATMYCACGNSKINMHVSHTHTYTICCGDVVIQAYILSLTTIQPKSCHTDWGIRSSRRLQTSQPSVIARAIWNGVTLD